MIAMFWLKPRSEAPAAKGDFIVVEVDLDFDGVVDAIADEDWIDGERLIAREDRARAGGAPGYVVIDRRRVSFRASVIERFEAVTASYRPATAAELAAMSAGARG